MIDTKNYLAVWKGILVVAQFLPGCLLCLQYALPRRRCAWLVVLPTFSAVLLAGCLAIAAIQLHTAPLARDMVYNAPTVLAYALLFAALAACCLLFTEEKIARMLYIVLSVAAYPLLLGLLYHAVTPWMPNRTLLISIGYYFIAFTLTRDLLAWISRRLVLKFADIELASLQSKIPLFPLGLCAAFLLQLWLGRPLRDAEICASCGLALYAAAQYLVLLHVVLRITAELTKNRQFMVRAKQMEEFYVNLTQVVQRSRTWRHDLRHHFTMIRQMNRDGHSDRIDAYLTHYLDSMPADQSQQYTGNYYIDALIYHFFSIAQSEGIHTYVQLSLPAMLRIMPYDLCTIFGNCLENALDACRQQHDPYRFIRVQGEVIQHKVVLIFSNSYNGHIRAAGHLLSTKPGSGHGYGVQSVEYSAAQYGGQVKVDYTDRVFRISIVLNQPIPMEL